MGSELRVMPGATGCHRVGSLASCRTRFLRLPLPLPFWPSTLSAGSYTLKIFKGHPIVAPRLGFGFGGSLLTFHCTPAPRLQAS